MSFDEHIEEGLKIKQPYTSKMHTAINHRARQQPLQAQPATPQGQRVETMMSAMSNSDILETPTFMRRKDYENPS